MEFATSFKEKALESIKVLIADDDPPTRILLKAAISQWGYDVIEASDGEDAWTVIQNKNPPSILILDWLMPRLDGIGLCERINQSKLQRPYIILLTQISGTPNIIKALEAGADEFLSKPFNMAELRSRLSVGAKIINYGIEFKRYISNVQTLVDEMLTTNLQISTLLQENQTTNLKNILTLNSKLSEIIETLKKLNLDAKK